MQALNAVIVDLMGPLGPLMLVGGLGVLMIVAALPFMLKKEVDPLEKLKKNNGQSANEGPKDRLRTGKSNKRLERYSSFLEPQNEKEYSAMRCGISTSPSSRLAFSACLAAWSTS